MVKFGPSVFYFFGPSVEYSVIRFSIYSVLRIRSNILAQFHGSKIRMKSTNFKFKKNCKKNLRLKSKNLFRNFKKCIKKPFSVSLKRNLFQVFQKNEDSKKIQGRLIQGLPLVHPGLQEQVKFFKTR